MSARVINPQRLKDFTIPCSPGLSRRHLPSVSALAKIKKDLFGPVDREETRRFVNKELEVYQEQSRSKWNFDFVRGVPMHNNTTANSCGFIWERVIPDKISVPYPYALTHSAHIIDSDDTNSKKSSILSELLLDARADKSNDDILNFANITDTERSFSSSDTDSESNIRIIQTRSYNKQLLINKDSNIRNRIQPKITDYLKERKRLAPVTNKKLSPTAKRARTSISTFLTKQ